MVREPQFENSQRRQTVRILLLEDDPISVEIVGTYLRRITFAQSELRSTATLSEALALLANAAADLVIADLHLPDSAGAATIAALVRVAGCPVIAMTSDSNPFLRDATLACGAYDFLQKADLTELTFSRLVRLAAMQVRTFHSLRESEARFRSLTDLSSDWYWEQDDRFRLTFMSSIEKLGLDPSIYLGKHRWDQPALNLTEDDWDRHRAQLARHEPFRDFEIERPAERGASVWIALSGEPVFDAEGRFTGYRGVGRDITARKQSEQEVLRLGRMYRALGAANEAILRATSPQEMFERACKIAVEAAGFVLGTVYLLPPGAKSLARVAASGSAAALVERVALSIDESQPGGRGLIGHACRTGQPVISNDYATDSRTQGGQRLGRPYQVGSAAVFPLRIEGELVGVFGLQHKDRQAFTDELTSMLQRLADSISFALGNFRREARRLEAESALQQSEAWFRQTFELAGSGIAHVALDDTFLRVNGKLCAILGYTETELVGRSVKDISHPEDRDAADAQRARMRADGVESVKVEKRYLRRDGSTVWVDLTVALAHDGGGRPLYEISIVDDITQRKREEAILALEHAVTVCLAAAETAAAGVQAVLRLLCELLGWPAGRYFAADEDAGVLRFSEAWGKPLPGVEELIARSRRQEYRRGEGLSGKVWESGEPLWLKDVSKQAGASASLQGTLRGGAFVFPITSGGRTIGVMSFSSEDARDPDARLLRAIGVIGSQVGQFLMRKKAEREERRRAADLLRASQRQTAMLKYQERVVRFGQLALAQRQPAELIERAVQAVLEALGAEAVAYVEPEPGAAALVTRVLVGVADAAAPATVPCPAGSPLVEAMQSGSRAVVHGARLPFPWAHALCSTALLPVRGENGVRGLLCAGFKTADAFAAEDLHFVEAAASVLSTALQRIDSENRLAYLAQFDPLTGLANRTLLADRFSQMIVQAKRRDAPLAVLFIDLDGFKTVNDTLGHAGGDALLKEVAARLQATVRDGDTVARISGDEFAIVLADMARLEDAALVAQKVIDRLAATVDVAGKEVFVTASVGIAVFPGDGADADTLIDAADAAMYRAKQSGRNTFQFFTAEINRRSRARAQMGAELRRALEREEFMLVYQPKIDLGTRRTIGAEALLRWKHPERGLVSPAEFIPVLEETGLIVAVGDWVLRRACHDLKAWQAAGLAVGPVAVNLSARQFRRADLDTHFKALVAAVGIDPGLIELEITESQLMQDPAHAIRVMRALRDGGMRIAIDDFGTGYSSLAYLNRFPVSALKIDRSFVKDMAGDRDAAAIVRTIIEMAHTLGFTVVAEGVETEEQASLLRQLRCEQAQGYLFAKPMPAQHYVKLLAPR